MKLFLSNLICKNLPQRSRTANKGDFGHVLVVGGDYGMGGAVRLAAEAAARVGAGLVSVATRAENIVGINSARPELMCHNAENKNVLDHLIIKCNVIVVGPGLGQHKWGQKLWQKIMKFGLDKKLVVDADALNLLSLHPQRSSNWILTPHPGEAARLLQTNVQTIQNDREQAVRLLQAKYGGISVLKGAGTLICGEDKEVSICEAGNPGMASGGMGDILSGIIGGLLAQGVELKAAAQLGVMLHAHAGDLAAQELGERGLLALDLLKYVRQLVNNR